MDANLRSGRLSISNQARTLNEDWAVALEMFTACRSRRGDKGRDNRKFLEALHYFTVHNITWRALPAEFGLEKRLEALLASEPEWRI